MHRLGQHDAAGVGEFLQPRRHIDAIAIDVTPVGDDVAKMDGDPQGDRRGVIGGALDGPDRPLHVLCPLHRIHRTGELGEYAVTQGLDADAVMFRDERSDHTIQDRHPTGVGPRPVLCHQDRVTDNIDNRHGRQAAPGTSVSRRWFVNRHRSRPPSGPRRSNPSTGCRIACLIFLLKHAS